MSLAANNAWKKRNRPALNVRTREWRMRIKLAAFALLGGKCCWPGCDVSDHRCLQIDHVNSDGRAERKQGNGANTLAIYVKIVHGLDLARYQLLCANHNWIKRYETERASCSNVRAVAA
jgi:hypothetical protein